MASTTDMSARPGWQHREGIRLRLLKHNLGNFWIDLRKHPVALFAGVVIILYILAAIFAPLITIHDPEVGSLRQRSEPPVFMDGGTWTHPLGADGQGRDIYTRIVYGARVSLWRRYAWVL